MLSPQQRKFWDDHGFLVLPGFASENDLEAVQKLLLHIWEVQNPNIVVDDLMTGVRSYLKDVQFGPDPHAFKVNDLYLEFEEVRSCRSENALPPFWPNCLATHRYS